MQQPTNPDGSVTGELRSDAKELRSKAADRLHSEVDSRKDTAVSQAQSVSSALGKTADNLDEGAPDWLKSAFRQGAQKIEQFADTIEHKDSRQILREVQGFARERPALFLGACAAAGFAAARVFKAGEDEQGGRLSDDASFGRSAPHQQGQSPAQSQPWGDAERSFDEGIGNTRRSNADPLVGSSTSGGSRGEFA